VTSTTGTDATPKSSARILGALNALIALLGAWLLAVAVADLVRGDITRGLWLLVSVVAIRWALANALREWGDNVGARIRDQWRRELPAHLSLPRREHERARGDLALAIDSAAEAPVLEVLATSARVAVLGFALVYMAAGWPSLAISGALLASAIPLYVRAGKRSEAMAVQYEQRRAMLEARQLELLRHGPELRALGAIPFGANEIGAISDSEHVIALRAIRVALESSLVTEFLSGVSIGLVAMVVGFSLLGGRISLEHALVAVLVTSEIFLQVRRFGTEFHRRENAVRSVALLAEVSTPAPPVGRGRLLSSDQLVTTVNSQPVSINVREGERVLVTGRSGSGKTTLLHTWLGWSPAVAGTVKFTARPIGYVSVDSALLSGTLRENLTLGAAIADAEVLKVLAVLDLVGPRFSDLDVLLLADGGGTSTGERVRLVLARALLCEPALVVLDDIAGVLDAHARESVRAALSNSEGLAIVEASVDDPVMTDFDIRIEVGA